MARKAQTATEYMIILAVVIVIALIAVSVLGGIPSIGGGAKQRSSDSYWQSADIGIIADSFGTDGIGNDDVLVLRNNKDDIITVTSIALAGNQVYSTATKFSPGEQKTINLNVDCGTNPGDRYSFDVSFNYTDDITGSSYEFNGVGHKLDGTCSQ